MFAMFFNVVFSMFVCYSAAFCQLCFYNKDWIGLMKLWLSFAVSLFIPYMPHSMAACILGIFMVCVKFCGA